MEQIVQDAQEGEKVLSSVANFPSYYAGGFNAATLLAEQTRSDISYFKETVIPCVSNANQYGVAATKTGCENAVIRSMIAGGILFEGAARGLGRVGLGEEVPLSGRPNGVTGSEAGPNGTGSAGETQGPTSATGSVQARKDALRPLVTVLENKLEFDSLAWDGVAWRPDEAEAALAFRVQSGVKMIRPPKISGKDDTSYDYKGSNGAKYDFKGTNPNTRFDKSFINSVQHEILTTPGTTIIIDMRRMPAGFESGPLNDMLSKLTPAQLKRVVKLR
ncbi:hypothetical protein [Deinococcus sp.]|uniref:hypothetical protein n=1 Tax=Deinococcus sp. TaxID=47478 RepID=UPI0025EB479F|nr:hypothetical protein [Deinococcus sp.]